MTDVALDAQLPTLDRPVPRATEVLRGGPLRWLAFAWLALLVALSTAVAAPGQVLAHRKRPTARTFQRWARRWARWILGPAGVRVEVEDRAHLDRDAPCIFVANHQNALDIFVLSVAIPYPFGFVAKAELRDTPLLGAALRHSTCVFVDKRDPRTAVRSVQEAGERIRSGNSVLVFPEGARSYSGGLLPFQRGAFVLAAEAGVPLVPVSVHGAYRLLDERRFLFRPGRVRVVLHPPVPMENVGRRELPEVIETVRATLARALADFERRHAPAS